jgi:uncharacterized protein (DUF433 family)
MIVVEKQEVPLRMDESGTWRVGKTRVTLDTVIFAFNQGQSPDEIVLHYSALKLADVYGALAYYLNHREEVDEYIREGERTAEEIRREIESRPEYQKLRERLLARKNGLE